MSILEDLNFALSSLKIPIETGIFEDKAPDQYLVLTPLSDRFDVFADDIPLFDISEVRISIFSKDNYISLKNRIVRALLGAGFTITDRRYIGHEDGTDYHHYAVDVVKPVLYEINLDQL